MLCFLVFSDSAYRAKVTKFLTDRVNARHVTIGEADLGTEDLFARLAAGRLGQSVQLSGLDRWPEGIDDLLVRLNLRREALAEKCQRPLLVWTLSTQLRAIAERAPDLWTWRSGVFQFVTKGQHPTDVLAYSPFFSLSAAEVADRRDRIAQLHGYLARKPVLSRQDVALLCELGSLRLSLRDLASARDAFGQAQQMCLRVGDAQQRVAAVCGLADVLEERGQLVHALALREGQMPALRDTGTPRAVALAQLKIADTLRALGRLQEAMTILVDEVVPGLERLQDNRMKAVALGGVADIHFLAGRLHEALRIHCEERLPVFEQLGEKRQQAEANSQIAAALLALGRLDEALHIMSTTVLGLYYEIGDVHATAVAQSRIGDIHQERGELDLALRIRTEVQMPTFDRLRDFRSAAMTRGQIADIHQARGQLREALCWCMEEERLLSNELDDRRTRAVATRRLASILQDLGRLEEALQKQRDEELPLYESLGDLRARAGAQRRIAGTLEKLGRDEEAVKLRTGIAYPAEEAYGMPVPFADLVTHVVYERGGVVFEAQLADPVAGTYRGQAVDRRHWKVLP